MSAIGPSIGRSLKRRSAPRTAGCFAPIMAVQTIRTISPEQSFVGSAAIGGALVFAVGIAIGSC
jgi:hypothetical protein